jgi:hypothetical protein
MWVAETAVYISWCRMGWKFNHEEVRHVPRCPFFHLRGGSVGTVTEILTLCTALPRAMPNATLRGKGKERVDIQRSSQASSIRDTQNQSRAIR